MNNVKFYKRLPNGSVDIRVYRIRQHNLHFVPGFRLSSFRLKVRKTLPQITVDMERAGYSRKRLYLEMPPLAFAK